VRDASLLVPFLDVLGFRFSDATFMMDFMSTSEGLELSRAFMRIESARVRRKLVELARALADEAQR